MKSHCRECGHSENMHMGKDGCMVGVQTGKGGQEKCKCSTEIEADD